ncbi:iron transporter [Acetobacter oeni]|uniref:DUF3649 domain-containing protein n=1 Tax=Acetobacter oeni TaxID=304077 RepID=A0A511XH20_9PROT|nr:iron transporter [Acetobacter oeni]MBB3882385.1 hypothetical protein [Acetobacter oeni]NHO18514.1 iron transporter [Acetobacter oeni]GBR09358.1 hypothetical protein AA21952_2835 [Acetobacter oeni LMG 21952]GEN62244.1 hypothetical protein AOE01nite_04680 [Acetobacter oeni]
MTTARYRLDIAARALAGTGGGYILAALISVAAARWFPMPRIDAVTTGMILALLVWPPVVMTAFAVHSLKYLCTGLALVAALLASLACWPG